VTAVGTDLVYGAVTKIAGAIFHFRHGTVDVPVVKKLSTGSIPGGLLGSALVILLPHITHHAEYYVQKAIGALLVIVAIVLVTRILLPLPADALSVDRQKFFQERGTVIWGAIVGFCVGATSVGSGSLLAPFLMILYPTRSSRVVGTDIVHAAVMVSVTALDHATASGVEWHLVPTLLAGSIPGVLLGSRLALSIPPRPLRTVLAALLLVTGYRLCF